MAIYSFNAQVIQRSAGRNAVAAAAYRHRGRMEDETVGRTYAYTGHKEELVHREIALPDETPAWLRALVDGRTPTQASEALWNKVEEQATRTNAVLAREIVMPLPVELSREQQVAMMRDYVREAFTGRGMVVDWVIHEKPGNPHAHVMTTMQPLSEKGFASRWTAVLDAAGEVVRKADGKIKYEVWNDGPALLKEWRATWAHVANHHLERAGFDVRLDHRSLKDRGSSLEPSIHLGPHAAGVHARTGEGELGRERERIRQDNADRIRANPAELIVLASSQNAVFRREDVERIARRYLPDEPPEALRDLVDQALAAPNVAATSTEMMDWRSGRMVETTGYATREMIALEQRMAEQARALRLDLTHGVAPAHVGAAIERQDTEIRLATNGQAGLSEEQREAVRYVTDARGIAAVVGFAGSGKSTMLKAANEAWSASGKRVFGAALAGKAADGLEESSGIKSRTLASWEYAWSQGRNALQTGDVFVIDEAGMISSGQLARVIDAIHGAGAKAVLVGDAMQLQPIQAGAAFRAISERVGYVELEGIRRQRAHEWQREASLDFARGRTFEALSAYRERGSVRFHDTAADAHKQVVADWVDANGQGSVLILAHANRDVDALNAGVRAARKAAGELAGTEIQFQTSRGIKAFAVGDRVLFLKNELDVRNGMLGTVEGLGLDTLTVRTDRGHTVELKPSEYEHFSHGYAATVHKAQGATVDRTLVYASDTMDRHLAYVAMTRHRDDAVLYASKEVFPSFEDLTQKLSRDGSSSTTLDHDFLRRRARLPDAPAPSRGQGARTVIQAAAKIAQPEAAEPAPDRAHEIARSATTEERGERTAPRVSQAQPRAEHEPVLPAGTAQAPAGDRPTPSRTERGHGIMVHAIPAASRTPDRAPSLNARVEANPTFYAARGAMFLAIEAVWTRPEPILQAIETHIKGGGDLGRFTALMRDEPERLGKMRGREEARGLLARLFPERAEAAAGRIEREAARTDAAFAASQVARAGAIWRDVMAQERALQADRERRQTELAERVRHAVPYLSDRAHGLLRAFGEAVAAGREAEQLAAARARDRQDLAAELVAFDAALTRRFGPEAFTELARDRFEDALGPRDRWAAGILREMGPLVRRFAAAQQAVETRLRQAPPSAQAQQAETKPAAQEPLFAPVTQFDRTPEEAARATVLTNGDLARELNALAAAARVVYREPEQAVQTIVNALGDRETFRGMVQGLFAKPEALGALAGSKKLFAGRAEKQARAAAEQSVKPFLMRARELQATYAGAFGAVLQTEHEARAAAAIPVPALSEEAKRVLDQLHGVALDRMDEVFRAAPAGPVVREELEAFGEAVERKFGHTLTAERVAPRPTPVQRATFERERARLETARTLAWARSLERARREERVRSLQQRNNLTR